MIRALIRGGGTRGGTWACGALLQRRRGLLGGPPGLFGVALGVFARQLHFPCHGPGRIQLPVTGINPGLECPRPGLPRAFLHFAGMELFAGIAERLSEARLTFLSAGVRVRVSMLRVRVAVCAWRSFSSRSAAASNIARDSNSASSTVRAGGSGDADLNGDVATLRVGLGGGEALGASERTLGGAAALRVPNPRVPPT